MPKSSGSVSIHWKVIENGEELGGVNYPLLSDDGKTVSRLYGVLDEKEGVCLRGTFIINPTNEITYLG